MRSVECEGGGPARVICTPSESSERRDETDEHGSSMAQRIFGFVSQASVSSRVSNSKSSRQVAAQPISEETRRNHSELFSTKFRGDSIALHSFA